METRIYNNYGEYYLITANSYLDIPNNNSDIINKVQNYLISSKDIDIQISNIDELLIHIYEEKNDIEYWVPLSPAFVEDIRKKGYQILCRLGSGSSNSSFLAYDGNKFVTLLINDSLVGNFNEIEQWKELVSDSLEFEEKVISLTEFPIYFNKVYNIIYSSIPYSDNNEYKTLSMSNYADRPIYVLEYLSYTVEQIIINNRLLWSKEQYLIFKEQIITFLHRALTYLNSNGYSYDDLKPDNIMVGYFSGISYLKLVDIESISVFHGDNIDRSINFLINQMDKLYSNHLKHI